MPAMTIEVWGVRGSIPSPGPSTIRYGGNTTCVSARIGSLLVVFDAGTGIRGAGNAVKGWQGDIIIALTHLHWDHVQGFPFFGPLYDPGRRISLLSPDRTTRSLRRIAGVDGVHFPLKAGQIPSILSINTKRYRSYLEAAGAVLTRTWVNHPGGCYGYRLDCGGRSFVFMPDNEIDPPYEKTITWEKLVAFCKGADVLVHDAQFLPDDMPAKRGWGHSLVQQACDLAAAADVKRLLLFHHDPDRDDCAVDIIQSQAREHLRAKKAATSCDAAAEGMSITLEPIV